MADTVRGRRVCLAIGISEAGELGWLPGAPIAAQHIGNWARCSGFDAVTVLMDDKAIGQSRWQKAEEEPVSISDGKAMPVTIASLRDELLRLLPPGDETQWMVLHFAGHGLRRDSTRTLWLPSDWAIEGQAIAVEALKAALEQYGVSNLTIISDACRSFADRRELDLDGSRVLPPGPVKTITPALDRFNAASDGNGAYMIEGKASADARCILSTALLNAIWGHEPEAFATADKVTSYSLLGFIPRETAQIGERYGLASMAVTNREFGHSIADLVYFDRLHPPQPSAEAISWPDPATTKEAEVPAAPPTKPGEFTGIWTRSLPGSFTSTDLAMPASTEIEGKDRRRARGDTDYEAALTPRAPRTRTAPSPGQRIRTALRAGQKRQPQSGNLIIRGGNPVQVWASGPAEKLHRRKSWQVAAPYPSGANAVVEYDDGLFAPVCIYPGLTTVIARGNSGPITGWMCVPPETDWTPALSRTTAAIAALQIGSLSPAFADALASEIRASKHGNPMLGAIAAYLYDYLGDRDNIRRMAAYYVAENQAIPYDIALLGLLKMKRRTDGRLVATVPAVRASKDPGSSERPPYTVSATPRSEGVVAGLCPWLRQGWDYLPRPEDARTPAEQVLSTAASALDKSSFTALHQHGAWPLMAQTAIEPSS